MGMDTNKRFWKEFIDIYHSLPNLWNTKDEQYNNRECRSFALNKLVKKLQEVEPSANQESVRRKINTIRTNFNRELRKIRLTQKELSKEVYSPTLWYFDQLSFLLNQVKRNNNGVSVDGQYDEDVTLMDLNAKKEIIKNDETMCVESIYQEYVTDNDTKSHYGEVIENNRDRITETEQNPLIEYTDIIEVPQRESTPESITPRDFAWPENHNSSGNSKKPLKLDKPSRSRELRIKRSKQRIKSQEPYTSRQLQSNLPSSIFTDEAAIYAQAWACDFRKLNPQQKLFAKKAIGDILTFGQLKALKLNTVQINANLLEEDDDEG